MKTKDMALIGLFAALLTICSWISIPTTIPFTLQTLGVFLAVGLLGGKRGTIAVLLYLCTGWPHRRIFDRVYRNSPDDVVLYGKIRWFNENNDIRHDHRAACLLLFRNHVVYVDLQPHTGYNLANGNSLRMRVPVYTSGSD